MSSDAIDYRADDCAARLIFRRAADKNGIGAVFLRELGEHLDRAERAADVRVIVLSAEGEHFSSGMDFRELASGPDGAERSRRLCDAYASALQRLRAIPKPVVAEIRGKVIAGGVGVAAACDLVFASREATFALPELLWGLVPAMVLPYLARRVGHHQAYRLALTSAPISAEDAHARGLVDELHAAPEAAVRRMMPRLRRLDPRAVACLKDYASRVAPIDERVIELSTRTTATLIADPDVRRRIDDFVTLNRLPWDEERGA